MSRDAIRRNRLIHVMKYKKCETVSVVIVVVDVVAVVLLISSNFLHTFCFFFSLQTVAVTQIRGH